MSEIKNPGAAYAASRPEGVKKIRHCKGKEVVSRKKRAQTNGIWRRRRRRRRRRLEIYVCLQQNIGLFRKNVLNLIRLHFKSMEHLHYVHAKTTAFAPLRHCHVTQHDKTLAQKRVPQVYCVCRQKKHQKCHCTGKIRSNEEYFVNIS